MPAAEWYKIGFFGNGSNMFETSVVGIAGAGPVRRRVRGLDLSLAAHCLVVVGWLAFNLSHLEFPNIPPDEYQAYTLEVLVNTPPPAPPPPPPPKRAPEQQPQQLAEMAPSIIPDLIPELEAPVPITGNPDSVENEHGVEGGVEGGLMGGVIGGMLKGEMGGRIGGTVGAVTVERAAGEPLFVPRDAPLPTSATRRVFPEYPREAQLRAMEGTVILRYVIARDGRVRDVEIVREARFRPFNASAVKALRQWQFKPFVENGQPVEVIHELTIYFVLERG